MDPDERRQRVIFASHLVLLGRLPDAKAVMKMIDRTSFKPLTEQLAAEMVQICGSMPTPVTTAQSVPIAEIERPMTLIELKMQRLAELLPSEIQSIRKLFQFAVEDQDKIVVDKFNVELTYLKLSCLRSVIPEECSPWINDEVNKCHNIQIHYNKRSHIPSPHIIIRRS